MGCGADIQLPSLPGRTRCLDSVYKKGHIGPPLGLPNGQGCTARPRTATSVPWKTKEKSHLFLLVKTEEKQYVTNKIK